MKQGIKKTIFVVVNLLLAGTLMLVGIGPFAAEKASDSKDAAVERTRQQVKMLDDLYKTVVVLITEHYVKDPSILPAATASKALFAEMKKKGWHEVRLLGLTDVLINQENKPGDAFEQAAATKLLAGDSAREEVVEKSGNRYLRVATGVPVVMEKCIMCHANFKGNKGNIGALSYTVPMVE
ncbi:MAG: c-type heme family protein [Gammaproteobacteria bacterium]